MALLGLRTVLPNCSRYGAGGAELSQESPRLLSPPLNPPPVGLCFIFLNTVTVTPLNRLRLAPADSVSLRLRRCGSSSGQRHAVHVLLQTTVLLRGPDTARAPRAAALCSRSPQVTRGRVCMTVRTGPRASRGPPRRHCCNILR